MNADKGVDQNGAEIVLNNLQPHSNIKRLTIHRYGGSRFPDWLGGPTILLNMVSLRLWSCKNVSAFPPLGQLPLLKHLYIVGLRGIQRVGAEFYGIKPSFVSLKALSFRVMPKWKEWLCLGGQGGEFPRLQELCILDCPTLTRGLPTHLPLLKKLVIESCEQLVDPLPRVPAVHYLRTCSRDISQWKELPPLLQILSITNSDSLELLLEEGTLQCNTNLKDLMISCSFSRPLYRICLPLTLKSFRVGGKKLEKLLLPEFFKCHLPFLQNFGIHSGTCDLFLDLPLGNFPRGHYLSVRELKGLEFLSISISDGDLPSFSRLSISGCPNLVSICFKNMKAACFQSLQLYDCPELIFPILGLPSSLTSLGVMKCNKLTSDVEFCLQELPSLTSLFISDIPNLRSLDGFKLPLLTSLQKLDIHNCPNLQSLTVERLPTSLSFLKIQNCQLLEDRCKFWTGEDWPRIAHIPHIVMDDQVL